MEVIPAIMPKDFKDLSEKVGMVYRYVQTVHVDAMDGTLTHHKNWPFFEEMIPEFHEITAGKKALPHWKEINYEVDVMMQNPEDSFAEWVNAGFHRVVIHVESTKKFPKIISDWKGVVEIGAAIGAATDNEMLLPLIQEGIDFVQFMGIAEIGFQGSPFEKTTLDKIRALRSIYPDLSISVDGGVNMQTAPDLLKAGANRLVIGSAIFNIVQSEKRIKTFATDDLVDLSESGEKKEYREIETIIKNLKNLEIKA